MSINATDVVENWDNETTVDDVALDGAGPVVSTPTSPTTGYYGTNVVNVNVTVTDAVSGVSAVYAQFFNGSGIWLNQELTAEGGDWFNYTVDVSSLADGNYTVSINATDNLGFWDNETTVDDVALDRVDPVVGTPTSPTTGY